MLQSNTGGKILLEECAIAKYGPSGIGVIKQEGEENNLLVTI